MQIQELEQKIEAILFAAGEPLEGDKIAQVLDIDAKTVKNLVGSLCDRYRQQGSALDIITLNGSYQMCTRTEFAPVIRQALEIRRNTPLSQAALEVLAIVAYNQPVTRSFVDQVRGVDCSSILRSLCEKGLVQEAGRLQIPGKPIAYETTHHFLRCFGLETLEQLPTIPELPPEKAEQVEEDEAQQMDLFASQP